MARFSPSPLVSSISGCIGGVEFAMGRAANTVKSRRRNRQTLSQAQCAALAFSNTVRQLWTIQADDFKLAWATYAAQTPYPDRFGNKRSCTAFQAALYWHSVIWDAINRNPAFTLTLLPPPPLLPVSPTIIGQSQNFNSAPGMWYTTTTSAFTPGATFQILYAARRGTGAKGGCTNFRFIGSQPHSLSGLNWKPFFNASPINWVLTAGEVILLRSQLLCFTPSPLTPGNRWTAQTTVLYVP